MVLCGKLAIDDNAASVSQMLAHFLGYPHGTVISKIQVGDGTVTVDREADGGTKEILQIKTPCVLAANKGLNISVPPRLADMEVM